MLRVFRSPDLIKFSNFHESERYPSKPLKQPQSLLVRFCEHSHFKNLGHGILLLGLVLQRHCCQLTGIILGGLGLTLLGQLLGPGVLTVSGTVGVSLHALASRGQRS